MDAVFDCRDALERLGRDGVVVTMTTPLATNVDATVLSAEDVLSAEEKTRAGAFANPRDAQRYTAHRVFLRRLLAGWLGVDASEIVIRTTERGRPFLPDFPTRHFSLSRSGDRLAVALSRLGAVGLDIEWLRPIPEWPELVREWGDQEQELVRTAPNPDREFLVGWTLREAVLKTLGLGLLGSELVGGRSLRDRDGAFLSPFRCRLGAVAFEAAPIDATTVASLGRLVE